MEWTLPLTTCVPWVSGISALGLGDGRKVSSVCGWWPGWGGQPRGCNVKVLRPVSEVQVPLLGGREGVPERFSAEPVYAVRQAVLKPAGTRHRGPRGTGPLSRAPTVGGGL